MSTRCTEFNGPIIFGRHVIIKCATCKGAGYICYIPVSPEEPIFNKTCMACGGVGLVKVEIDNLKTIPVQN